MTVQLIHESILRRTWPKSPQFSAEMIYKGLLYIMAGEKRIRTIAKTISWRVLATSSTMLIVYIYTREFVLMLGVGVIEVTLKLILFYAHERLWSNSRWGLK